MASETYTFRGNLNLKENCSEEAVIELKEKMESYGIEVELTENKCSLKVEIFYTFRSILEDIEEFLEDLSLSGTLEGEEMDTEFDSDWEKVSYTFGVD